MLKKKKKAAVWGGGGRRLIILLSSNNDTGCGLWCVVSGVSWKSSGEMLAAGVEDVNAVSGLNPGFQELPGRWGAAPDGSFGRKLFSRPLQTLPRIPSAPETRTTSTQLLLCARFTSRTTTCGARAPH